MTKPNLPKEEIIENFVHDIRTPLASIQLGATGIKNYLPAVLQNYRNLMAGKPIQQPISDETMKLLLQVIENIEKEVGRMKTMINEFVKQMRES